MVDMTSIGDAVDALASVHGKQVAGTEIRVSFARAR